MVHFTTEWTTKQNTLASDQYVNIRTTLHTVRRRLFYAGKDQSKSNKNQSNKQTIKQKQTNKQTPHQQQRKNQNTKHNNQKQRTKIPAEPRQKTNKLFPTQQTAKQQATPVSDSVNIRNNMSTSQRINLSKQ